MKRILYYVTDHGLGHATRTIAVIRNMEKENVEIVVRNTTAKKFFQHSLPKSRIISGTTDVGPVIKRDGYSIDSNKSKKVIEEWLDKLDSNANKECDVLEKVKPNLIITDIGTLAIMAAKKKDIPVIAISNFSWYDVIPNISIKHKEFLKEIYDEVALALKLPLGTNMNHFPKKKNVNLICRKPTVTKNAVKKALGLNSKNSIIFVALNTFNKMLKLKTDPTFNIISNGVRLSHKKVIQINNWIEGQNLVAVSDLVICKCGYGIISECLTNGIPFMCFADENHLEQKAILEDLKNMNIRPQISPNDLENTCITENLLQYSNFKKKKNDPYPIIRNISEFLY